MASIRKIKKYNDSQFLTDIKKATSVMVFAQKTGDHFLIQKKELMQEAESRTIKYYMTTEIFKVGRTVMIVT